MRTGKENKIQVEDGTYLYYCSSCDKYLTKDKFCNNKSLKYRDGVNSKCKQCQKYHENKYRVNLDYESKLRLKLKHILSSAKSRSKKLNLDFDLDEAYVKYLWESQNGLCAISKIPMTCNYGDGMIESNASIDRINSQFGYIKGNVQLTCWAINRMKGTMNIPQLIYYCTNVVNNYKNNN